MKQALAEQIEALREMTVAELREKYAEAFGEETQSRHKDFLRKRIAWRLQANVYGGLSERALRRAAALANESDLRLTAPKGSPNHAMGRTTVVEISPTNDRRLPMPGTVITREYRGRTIAVTVLEHGFEYEGEIYQSLTAVARAVTGTHWNGYHFFRAALGGPTR